MKKKRRGNCAINIGIKIQEYRVKLNLPKNSRKYFIEDRIKVNLMDDDWISEKTLMNIENGHNIPSLKTLKLLAIALEVDFIELVKEIEGYILVED